MNKYYVYAYINRKTGLPYYIGKGSNRRAFVSHGRIKTPKNKHFIVFLETSLTEVGALALERRYIKWYGCKHNDTGILHNRTEGGDGGDTSTFIDYKLKRSLKGMTYDQIYGTESAAKLRRSRTNSNIARGARSESTKRLISETRTQRLIDGTIQPVLSDTFLATMKSPPIFHGKTKTCEYCGKSSSFGNYARWHGNKCRVL